MAETSIEWCDFTFNPWEGCSKVSPGCKHCYAEARDRRFHRGEHWGPAGVRRRTSGDNWRKPLAWDRAAVQANVAADLAGKPRPPRPRVFCASLADVFEDRPELVPWRAELLDLIARTPFLDWLLLTKRPQNITPLLRSTLAFFEASRRSFCDAAITLRLWLDGVGNDGTPWPPPNVWLGTTVEDQQRANERIPALLEVPAVVRFLSCEPLLERVDLSPWIDEDTNGFRWRAGNAVQWVIIGGESGPGARPLHLEWARDLVRQCRAADVAPFVKQLGACAVASENDDRRAILAMRAPAGGDMAEWPADLRVREFPSARNH